MLKQKKTPRLEIEKLTGSIISTLLAVGRMARLYTRELYAAQASVSQQHFHVRINTKAKEEIKFWFELNFDTHTQPIWRETSMATIYLNSDASNDSWGGTLNMMGNVILA